MKSMFSLLLVSSLLAACTPVSDGTRPIRTQADVDRYNATVSSEGEKLVCSRERVVGSNLPKFVCMTVNQRERLAREAGDVLRDIQGSQQPL
ncbi:MAG: hypothetical protein H7A05_04710 [Pseudomonadales bacterium]|nr:hypothetical protein [Pseudomonadales bacterium]MCP5329560.1 hypothetical protein [Pseudomonadales bacterium]MCP5343901.1 hypothetical protein [Pseudomonadales bacterium]